MRHLATGLIVLGLAGMALASLHDRPTTRAVAADAPTASPGEPLRVEVVTPQRRKALQPAQVEALERVEIVAKVSGYLDAYAKDLDGKTIDTGSRVKAGQVLATLLIPELEKELEVRQAVARSAEVAVRIAKEEQRIAEAERDRTAAELDYHRAERERHEDLFANKSIQKSLLDAKVSQFKAAEAALKSAAAKAAKAKVEIEAAELKKQTAELDAERTQRLYKYRELTAPAAGEGAVYVVTRRWTDPGSFVQPGAGTPRDAVLSLARVDSVKVVVEIPEFEAVCVGPGDKADFQPSGLPGQKREAEVSRVAMVLDPTTRTMRVELDFKGEHWPLTPGMFGTATVLCGKGKAIWVVPFSAIQKDKEGAFVFRVASGRAERVAVTVVSDDGTQATIQAKELLPDSQVVRLAPKGLQAGRLVTVESKGN